MRKQFTVHSISVANKAHDCLVAKGCKALIETENNFRQSIMCQQDPFCGFALLVHVRMFATIACTGSRKSKVQSQVSSQARYWEHLDLTSEAPTEWQHISAVFVPSRKLVLQELNSIAMEPDGPVPCHCFCSWHLLKLSKLGASRP